MQIVLKLISLMFDVQIKLSKQDATKFKLAIKMSKTFERSLYNDSVCH